MVKTQCEVYSRIVGYIRPIGQWNDSKKSEFHDRVMFKPFDEPNSEYSGQTTLA